MKSTYFPKVGDVVLIKRKRHVLIYLDDREELGAMGYDRTYYFVEEAALQSRPFAKKEELLKKAYTVNLKNTIKFPDFKRIVADYYEIGEDAYLSITRKKG